MRVCAAALFDLAYVASGGCLLSLIWLSRGSTPITEKRLAHWLTVGSVLMLVAIPSQLLLLAAAMTGDLSWTLAWSALPDVLTTHAGHTLMVSYCLVPLLLALSLVPSALKNGLGICAGIALLLGITFFRAAFGHAASDGDFTLREFVQILHLSSIAVWGGGVVVAGMVVVPQLSATAQPEAVLPYARRLSSTVTIALIVVVLSGVYNSWKGLGGSLSPLTHTAWGRVLMVKICMVLLALFHGARVRLLLPQKWNSNLDRLALMSRLLRTEALLMLVVLIVSAGLANLPPADM